MKPCLYYPSVCLFAATEQQVIGFSWLMRGMIDEDYYSYVIVTLIPQQCYFNWTVKRNFIPGNRCRAISCPQRSPFMLRHDYHSLPVVREWLSRLKITQKEEEKNIRLHFNSPLFPSLLVQALHITCI